MKDSTRRLLLFLIIVVAGSVMILIDIPIFYLLLGVMVLAILLLFLTGAILLPSLKRGSRTDDAKKAKAIKDTGSASAAKKSKKKRKVDAAQKPARRGIGGLFGSLGGGFSVILSNIKSVSKSDREKEEKRKKIDEMLDKSVAGYEGVSLDDIVPDVAPVKKKTVSDPFTDLAQDSIKIDQMEEITPEFDIPLFDDTDFEEDSIEIDTEVSSDGSEDISQLDIGLDEEEESITIDDEEDDEVAEILNAHRDELALPDEGDELGSLTGDMGDMDDIDLGSIDLDSDFEDGEPGNEIATGPAVPPKESGTPSQGIRQGKSEIPAIPDAKEMIAFGSGSREDDDLMSSLKSDAKAVKKSENLSLLRDMKDMQIPAGDLEMELEGLMKGSKRKE